MNKMSLNEQAQEILRIAEQHGVEQNFFFLTTFKRYQVQLQILNDLEKTIKEDGTLVTKEYVKGRKNVYSHPAGGGKYMAILQCCKTVPTDESKQRQAALLAFSAFTELKNVILVDEDVDIFDTNDVLWAMNTRFQGDLDIERISGVRCHPLDPSANPLYNQRIPAVGVSCKTIFDCTVPFDQKDRFKRAPFLEVDYKKWLK